VEVVFFWGGLLDGGFFGLRGVFREGNGFGPERKPSD